MGNFAGDTRRGRRRIRQRMVRPLAEDGGTPEDVAEWLHSIALGQYATVFANNGLFGTTLAGVSNDRLKEIGIKSLGHRKKLIASLHCTQPSDGVSSDRQQRPQQRSPDKFAPTHFQPPPPPPAAPRERFGYSETYEDHQANNLVVEDGTLGRHYMTSSGNAQSLQFAGKAGVTRRAPEDRPPIPTTFVAAHEKVQSNFERFDWDNSGELDRFEMEAMAAARNRAAAEARRNANVVEDGSLERKYMTSSGNAQSLQFAGKAAVTSRAPEDRPPIPTTFVAAHEKVQTEFERFDGDGNGELDRFEMEAMAASRARK